MYKLKKHELRFEESMKYLRDNLENVNSLSIELLDNVKFHDGHFFTLLPLDANSNSKHNFLAGGILPQNPIEEYFIDGHKSFFSIKSTIRDEISNLILNEIKLNDQLSCVFDDVSGTKPDNTTHPCFVDNYTSFYEDEVYYILQKKNISYKLIWECLKSSTSFWHSLCVITTADLNDVQTSITLEKIHEICLKTVLVIVGAYDAEGYIFWEKNLQEKKFFE